MLARDYWKPMRAWYNVTPGLLSAAYHYSKLVLRYQRSVPHPYGLLWVDPADIEYCTLPSLMAQLELPHYGTYVTGGDWDERPRFTGTWYTRSFDPPVIAKFKDHALVRAMVDHYTNDVPWEATDWYQWIHRNPGAVGQYRDPTTMEERLAELDNLYSDMKDNGYRVQRELTGDNLSAFTSQKFPCPEHHEIDINIGRNGDLYFNFNGRHRLAIAKILGINKVPVRVFTRHVEWQKHRHEVVHTDRSTQPNRHLDHPDIQPLRTTGSSSA